MSTGLIELIGVTLPSFFSRVSIASLIAKELPSNFVIHAPTGYLVNWGPYHFDTPFIGSDPFFGAFFPKGKWLQFKGGKMNE